MDSKPQYKPGILTFTKNTTINGEEMEIHCLFDKYLKHPSMEH